MKWILAYLHLFKAVLLIDGSQDVLLAAFLHLPSEQQLIEYEICLLKVEDDVQFADVSVVLVHLLDVAMHDLEGDELVVIRGTAGDEEERGVATVDDFLVWRELKGLESA